MRMYDIIHKKRNGGELSDEEIDFLVRGCTDESIPDYQLSAFCMAVYFRGMTDRETAALTLAMAKSGDCIDLSGIDGYTVDKHSTGGVGDKTSLIVAPIVAACGGKIAKMSGRGLGHTGGTVDKLEAIPGFRTELTPDEFIGQVNNIGLCIVGQSGELAPADKKLYALRDVTATVESIPLIASSIMSKKLAAGSQGIVLDVKTGSGAFMKTAGESETLAKEMVAIGKAAGKKIAAVITNMDIPLGNYIGNSLEVIEAVKTLMGEGESDLTEVSLSLATQMLCFVTDKSEEECRAMAEKAIEDGSALNKLREMITAQGGNAGVADDFSLFKQPKYQIEIRSEKEGFISHTDAEKIGIASVILGAGREKKGDPIDPSAGIILKKKTGDFVEKGQTLAVFHTDDSKKVKDAEKEFFDALTFSDTKPDNQKLIYKIIK
ncbi:MAG: pyrimidine-nucleoside phosphorylase [Clostridiaceae bacterium]|nr:pyrimidine-nucleoside phosphorylase [Clostridiaceae bacterium]MDY5889457.1 pyrimidine-nucleoside phosphorylase [Oscillospiraceae bacterium]